MTQKPGPVSYPVVYNKGKMDLMPVLAAAMGRSWLSCGCVALKLHKRLMSSLITLQWNTSTKLPNKTRIRASHVSESWCENVLMTQQSKVVFWLCSWQNWEWEKYHDCNLRLDYAANCAHLYKKQQQQHQQQQQKTTTTWRVKLYTYVVICNPLISQEPVFHFSPQNSMRVCRSLQRGDGAAVSHASGLFHCFNTWNNQLLLLHATSQFKMYFTAAWTPQGTF